MYLENLLYIKINIRENRGDNNEWTIQSNIGYTRNRTRSKRKKHNPENYKDPTKMKECSRRINTVCLLYMYCTPS